ncbi:MAG: hypothetical protein B6242_14040 [Anaerolineaceae bacterium 4572_78]|nr:MAG: hypothetical protein B6242_14040 [Anaerolineaceae bacterium 4572_78]
MSKLKIKMKSQWHIIPCIRLYFRKVLGGWCLIYDSQFLCYRLRFQVLFRMKQKISRMEQILEDFFRED